MGSPIFQVLSVIYVIYISSLSLYTSLLFWTVYILDPSFCKIGIYQLPVVLTGIINYPFSPKANNQMAIPNMVVVQIVNEGDLQGLPTLLDFDKDIPSRGFPTTFVVQEEGLLTPNYTSWSLFWLPLPPVPTHSDSSTFIFECPNLRSRSSIVVCVIWYPIIWRQLERNVWPAANNIQWGFLIMKKIWVNNTIT